MDKQYNLYDFYILFDSENLYFKRIQKRGNKFPIFAFEDLSCLKHPIRTYECVSYIPDSYKIFYHLIPLSETNISVKNELKIAKINIKQLKTFVARFDHIPRLFNGETILHTESYALYNMIRYQLIV